MVFTKSLLIKALGGVVGVAGTGVGVLAGTGVFNKKDSETNILDKATSEAAQPQEGVTRSQVTSGNGEASGNEKGASVEEVSRPQQSNDQSTNSPNPQSPDETSTTTSPSAIPGAGESQKQSTTDGQQRDGGSGGGNLPSNPDSQHEVSEGHNSPNTLPSTNEGLENKAALETPEQSSKQPGTGSRDGQVSDPKNSQQGIQTTQDGQDNGLGGSPTNPGLQSPQQPVIGEQNSPNTLPSAEGEGGNKEQQDGSGGQGSLQPGAENPTNPDSGVDSHRAQTSDISQPSNSTPQAGQPAGDSVDSTPPGTSGTPGAADAQDPGTGGDGEAGSTPTNELVTEGGNGASGGGSESSDISTTDQATQSQSKEDKINAKLKTLNIPSECNFSSGSTSTTCSINKDQLNQMKFQNEDGNSENGDVDSLSENIQLKIEIPSENKKTAYGLNDSEDENNLLFTFSEIKNQIEVVHDNLTLYPKTNPEFKIEDDAFKWIWSTFSDLAKKVGLKADSSKGSNAYTFDDERSDKTLKYSLDGTEDSIKTLNIPNTTGTIDVEGDKENYNQGVKVTFREKVTSSEGTDSLEANTSYEIKYKDGDDGGWYLSKVTQTTGEES